MFKLSDYFFLKNTMLVWEWLRFIVSMLGRRKCAKPPRFLSKAKRAFVDDTTKC